MDISREKKVTSQNVDDSKKYLGSLLFILTTVLGGYLRIIDLFKPNLIFDEGYSVLAVKGILNSGFPVFPSGILYPRGIFFSYLSSIFTVFTTDELSAVRVVSALSGIALIVSIFFLASEFFSKKSYVPLLVTIVVALSPYLIEVSRYGRFYSLMTVMFAFSLLFGMKLYNLNIDKLPMKRFFRPLMLTFLTVFFAVFCIFSDSLGALVLIPLSIVSWFSFWNSVFNEEFNKKVEGGASRSLLDIKARAIIGGVLPWLKGKGKYYVCVLFFTVLAIAGQFYLERYTFYSLYKKEIDQFGLRENVVNIPLFFDFFRSADFALKLFGKFFLSWSSFILSLVFLRYGWFKLFKNQKGRDEHNFDSSFKILAISSLFIFLAITLFVPQFQIRYFYILYLLILMISAGFLYYLEEFFKVKGIGFVVTILTVAYFSILLYVNPLNRDVGFFRTTKYTVSSSLDYYPDSEEAFSFVEDTADSNENAILVSTYRKEIEYYPTQFDGMRFVLVPFPLEKSLPSLPINTYEQKVLNARDLEREVAFMKKSLDIEKEDIVVDPVTGYVILRPQDVIKLSAEYPGQVFLVTSRFDYLSQYVSEEYIRFLSDQQSRVVYQAEDDGISNVYLF